MPLSIEKNIVEEAKTYIHSPETFIQFLKDNGVSKSQCVIRCITK